MIKSITILLIAFTLLQSCSAPSKEFEELPMFVQTVRYENRISKIKTNEDVRQLLISIDSLYTKFEFSENLWHLEKNCWKFIRSVGEMRWVKADFDQNGYADILVVGELYRDRLMFSVMGFSNDSLKLSNHTYFPYYECIAPTVKMVLGRPSIVYARIADDFDSSRKVTDLLKIDTLVYAFDGFIELDRNSNHDELKQIVFTAGGSYSGYDEWSILIDSSGNASALFRESSGKEFQGRCFGTITKTVYREIADLINYINFKELNDGYRFGSFHEGIMRTEVTFANGVTKRIVDYGMYGTFGLSNLYRMLWNVKDSVDWTPDKTSASDSVYLYGDIQINKFRVVRWRDLIYAFRDGRSLDSVRDAAPSLSDIHRSGLKRIPE